MCLSLSKKKNCNKKCDTVSEVPKVPEIPVSQSESQNVDRSMKATRKCKALLVGINYTGTSNELRGCVNDVKNVYTYLTKDQKFDPSQISILTDESRTPLQSLPTYKNIISGIRWLVSDIDDDCPTTLYMHYSGHGTYLPDRNRDEDDGRDEAICPLDCETSGMLIDDVLRAELVGPLMNKPNVRLTCVFDSCHSGTVVDLRYNVKSVMGKKTKSRTYTLVEDTQYATSKAKIVVFSGCMDSQTSADAYINGKSQGMMTCAYLDVLHRAKEFNEPLTYKSFIYQLQDYASKNKYTQVPQLSFNEYEDLNTEFSL